MVITNYTEIGTKYSIGECGLVNNSITCVLGESNKPKSTYISFKKKRNKIRVANSERVVDNQNISP